MTARQAVLQQAYILAATRLGLAEQIAQRIGYADKTPMRPQNDAAQVALLAALEPAHLAEAFAAGQAMTLASAFTTILPKEPIVIAPMDR